MSDRPPPPPRRGPPPPPPRKVSSNAETTTPPTSITARIAGLHLGHLSRSLAHPHPLSQNRKDELAIHETETDEEPATEDNDDQNTSLSGHPFTPPPPLPPRWTRPGPSQDSAKPDLAQALGRKPPPLPTHPSVSTSPPVPIKPHRLPPAVTRPPPIPPKVEAETYEEALKDEHVGGPVYDQGENCIKCRDFAEVDTHSSHFPRHTVTSLDNLAYDLTEPFPYETDKARAIFTWLYHNVAYDAQAFFSGELKPATAEATLASGLAVCEGYAGLFKSLAERVGLQVMTVSGHGKGYGYATIGADQPVPEIQSNHAWNCVQMDGEWHLIDSCWGAGYLEGTTYNQVFAPMWFTSTPSEFGRRHFPTDPGYQLISDEDGGPVSWEDYILAPEGPILFQDFYKLDFLPDLVQPATKDIEGGRHISFHIWKRCEHMSTAEADNYVVFIATSDDRRTPLELNAEGGWSVSVHVPQGGDVSLFYVSQVDGRDAKGLGVSGFRAANGRKAMSFGGCCRWNVV